MTVATAGCSRMVLVGTGTTAVPGRREGDMALRLRTEFYAVNN